MGRDTHEDVGEGDEENVGEETELLSTSSLEGLDFDRLRLTSAEKLYIPLYRLLEERLGEFGPYQRKLYLLVCLPAALTATITMARSSLKTSDSSSFIPLVFNFPSYSIFTAYSPLHRCLVPQCDDRTLPSYR